MTIEEYWAMVHNYLRLTPTGFRSHHSIHCRDENGNPQLVPDPASLEYERRRDSLERVARGMGIELPPLKECH